METTETVAQEALRLLKEIPAEQFIIDRFTNGEGKCCAMGHYTRLKSENPDDYSVENCEDECEYTSKDGDTGSELRNVSNDFMFKPHGVKKSIAWVNNYDDVNGYNEPDIKDRVIHCLEDMVAAGY